MFELMLTTFAVIASSIAALFAIWRWEYAKKSYSLQKKQLYLQILMLAESREYWKAPKQTYIDEKKPTMTIEEEIDEILKGLNHV